MKDLNAFAEFMNKCQVTSRKREWKAERLDALDKLFHNGIYQGHMVGDNLMPSPALDAERKAMLLRMWSDFRVKENADASGGWISYDGPTLIAGKGVLKNGVMTFIPDPIQPPGEGWTVKPLSVANPEGIVPETKIDVFVKRLNAEVNRFAYGSIVAKPFGAMHHIYSGRQIVGSVKDGALMVGPVVPPLAAEWMRETWRLVGGSCAADWTITRSPMAAPQISPRVHRFLAALTDHEIDFKDDYGYTVKAPFTTTVLPSQNVIIVLGNGVEFGEVRGDDFTPDTAMPCDTRAILRHVWREVIREEALLNRITALEAECAEKTRRLDQIAAIIKGDK